MIKEEYLWSQRFRPHKIADVVLPEDIKKNFQAFVDNKNVPNLVLSGGPGMGKTTVAMAMLDEIGADYIKKNGSKDGNIDTLRNEITQFASSVSFAGGRKYVILDEADYLNAQSTQPALRAFMEDYSKNCGFILTCNYKNRLIEPLRDSRCTVIDFSFSKKEKPVLMAQFYKRVINILDLEKVEYDKKAVIEVIAKGYPDWRGILNRLQTYSQTGKIDTGILVNLEDDNLKVLLDCIRERDYTNSRKWVAENLDGMEQQIIRKLYDTSKDYMTKDGQVALVLILDEAQYRMAFSPDRELTMMAAIVKIMGECEFL
jgi:DNA polymerase III delta prime subunit